jgi:trk system potassium uptake protein TrkH
MNGRAVAKMSAPLLALVAATMVAPLALALYDGDLNSAFAFLVSGLSCGLVALLLRQIGRKQNDEIHRKDAIGVVALIWTLMSIFGAMPFVVEGSIPDPAGALFEAVSGFTTAGGSVAPNVEDFTRATNLWRCETHFVGGMGIVVLFVAVFPQIGVGAKQLFKNEVSGPTSEGLRPRIKQTAVALWWLYGGLTALCAVLLAVAGMPVFDAICHAMSALGSGGYSTKAASIGYYPSPAIHWITSVFMLIAALNFGLYYSAARGRWRDLFENPEARFYVAVNLVVILVVAAYIWPRHPGLEESLRYATFQTLSITSSTGYMTEDFDTWPNVCRFLFFLLTFMGGCAGSTAGGIKAIRVYVALKVIVREVRSLASPNVVATIKLGKASIPPNVISEVMVFIVTYLLIFAGVSMLLVALDVELVAAMTGTIACLSNVGPGLDALGPAQNYGGVPALGKLALSFAMIAGRLEIFVLLSIFSRELWRR